MNKIHGHEVLDMMLASGKVYTRASLAQDIVARFGTDARFYTCSADNMTAEQLVEFFDARGKLVAQPGGIQTSPDLICKH